MYTLVCFLKGVRLVCHRPVEASTLYYAFGPFLFFSRSSVDALVSPVPVLFADIILLYDMCV